MIGPTGVGKTEVARRMAKITGAPFTKVEATKYTEVGYVGRDGESMVRDLVETSVKIAKEELYKGVREEAESLANDRLVKLLAPGRFKETTFNNPFEMLQNMGQQQEPVEEVDDTVRKKRRDIREGLLNGRLEDKIVENEVGDRLV